MRILGNCPLVLTRKWLSSAPLMLLVATFVLPSAQAQDKGAQPSVGPTPAGVADASLPKQPDAWGPDRDGLRTRLLPAQEEYVIGRPAKFRLEMQNFGERERTYDSQQVAVNNSLRVSNHDGKPVPYVAGSFQTGRRGGAKSIAPGRTVVLFDGLDLADQYLFVKPGTYTIQFRGTNVKWHSESEIPPSNKITVEMRPGAVSASMQVLARLIEILPEKWDMSLNGRVYEVNDGKITPPGWESGRGTYLSLMTNPAKSGLKPDVLCVEVWVAERRLDWTGKARTGKAAKPGEAAEYLGKGADGHVYWKVPEQAETAWPDIRAKVRAALQIELVVPGPGASK